MQSSSFRRLQVINNHLLLRTEERDVAQVHVHMETTSGKIDDTASARYDVQLSQRLQKEFDKDFGRGAVTRDECFRLLLSRPEIFKIDDTCSMSDYRRNVHDMYHEFLKYGLLTVEKLNEQKKAFFGVLEALMPFDVSLAAKLVVSLQLYGSCLYNLGTQRHRKYIEDLDSGRDIGCFMMTEIAQGSDVRSIGTTATYDPSSQEFIINTPNNASMKFWIGNSAVYGTRGVVFAQLITSDGQSHGVHAFLVDLRHRDTMEPVAGIRIRDIGAKWGWNGVDNGCLDFNMLRIPRENLLNRIGDVNQDGTYSSEIASPSLRFGKTLEALVFGRLIYCIGPTRALEVSTFIACCYAHQRKQFGRLIWNYSTHSSKMVPIIAKTIAFKSTNLILLEQLDNLTDEHFMEYHAIIAGVKAYICEFVPDAMSTLRAMCGGHGYLAANRLGPLMADMHVFQTAEGDSTVLYQQLARFLLKPSKLEKYPSHDTAESLIRDNDFYRSCFRFHVQALSQSISANMSKSALSTDVWNDNLNNSVELAKAYVHTTFLDNLLDRIAKCVDEQVKMILQLSADVFALQYIEDHSGFFLKKDYFKPHKAIAIKEILDIAIKEMSPYCLTIVNGFSVPPDKILRAPIALSNMSYISNLLEHVKMPQK